MSNKLFWNTVKPFMTNKGIISDDKIIIESENDVKIELKGRNEIIDVNAGDIINNEETLVEMFNKHYVNIVEQE